MHGISAKVVTDNAAQFISDEFCQFNKRWMFKHTTTSPYHHRTNALAEIAVKIVKSLIKKAKQDGGDIWLAALSE